MSIHTLRKTSIIVLTFLLMIGLLAGNIVLAQEETATPDHSAHHPEATPTTEPEQSSGEHSPSGGGMGGMGSMGGMMGMMDMMQDMHGMMGMMMEMEMSDEMRTHMEEMRGMMDMMMGMMGGQPEPADDMAGMDMDTGYSVDNLAPLAHAYYQGTDVYFIHPEASDAGVAEVLTNMMGTDVATVPGLAQIPAEFLGNVYVFTNGISAMGPLGFQSDVFDSVPNDANYTPLRAVNLVTWQENVEPRELTSVEEILAAAEASEVVIVQPGVVVNMPILVWGSEQR